MYSYEDTAYYVYMYIHVHVHTCIVFYCNRQWSAIINNWMKSVPENVESKLQQNILRQVRHPVCI